MPIQLDYFISRERFKKALELAKSDASLPQQWIERTKKVGQSPSRTFTAMLGTALLAKATDPKVDPFALKTRNFPSAYSARSLCKDVLVPCAVEAGVHLGTTGREPLNNQPFFRHERVGPDMKVRGQIRPHLDYLCESLGAMKRLDRSQALGALAAFLRVRLQEGSAKAVPIFVGRALGVPELITMAAAFVTSDPESGKRGQALVAASLDLVFDDVRTTRVYDPSRHWPGDVVVFVGEALALAVEVKQRAATESEILQFAERCAQMGVRRAAAATLFPDQPPLYVDELRKDSWLRHGVHLFVLEDTGEVLSGALTWTIKPLEQALAVFPQLMASRLEELEVSPGGLAEWAALVKQSD